MSKISEYAEATSIADADAFLGRDVSDTSMAATGTTKEFSFELIRETLGIVPQPTQVPLSTSYTPSQLTFRAVHAERSKEILPLSGPGCVANEDFLGDSWFAARYSVLSTGTITAATIDNGALTISSSGTGDRKYRSYTKLVSASAAFTAIKVEPGFTAGTTCLVSCGFYADSVGGETIEAAWNLATGAIGVSRVGATTKASAYGADFNTNVPGPTADTGPMWLGLILGWPIATLVTSKDGITWDVQTIAVLERSAGSPLVESTWSTLRPGFRFVSAGGAAATFGAFRAGYPGLIGHLNHRTITHVDGTPYRRDGKYYVSITIPHGGGVASSAVFLGQHLAICSFDPTTYRIEIVSHIFFDWNGWVSSLSVGCVAFDPDTHTWHVVASSWGVGNQATGIDLVYGTTQRDMLTPGAAIVLKGTTVTTGEPTRSFYDASFRKEGGTWKVACVETDTRTNWSDHYAVLMEGSSLAALTVTARDTSIAVDGTQWMKCGGNWYFLGGGSADFYAWSATLTNRVQLTTWQSAMPSGLVVGLPYAPHPSTMVVDDGWRTRYLYLTYDGGLIFDQGSTRGGMVVAEADEKPTGQEFAPRLVPRYYGA